MNTTGHIFQLNISPGGVPKRPIREALLGELGLDGDKQRDKQHHGGPDRALCLFALETIIALQREGHPIYPGSTGENITTVGVDLGSLSPGQCLRLGDDGLVEITGFASPCRSVQSSFAGQRYSRIAQKANPGDSRLYARVIQGGRLWIGAAVQIIAADQSCPPM